MELKGSLKFLILEAWPNNVIRWGLCVKKYWKKKNGNFSFGYSEVEQSRGMLKIVRQCAEGICVSIALVSTLPGT